MSIGSRDLNNILARINSKLACSGQQLLHMRGAYGKHGIDRADDTHLTGLLPRTQLAQWLYAFEDGLDYRENAPC